MKPSRANRGVSDLRRYARQTQTRLIIGGLVLLFFLGDGLIYIIYGKNAALVGLICILGGLMPVVLIWFALWVMEWIVRRGNRD